MIFNNDIALQTAGYLLRIKAVKLSPKELFTWASGIKSPIYCDNRVTLSFPEIRTFIRDQFVAAIHGKIGKPDLIAGVATGGIAQGALVAQELDLPFAYVRTTKKDHGLTNQIEGKVESGQSVVVVEDLISTGGSSLEVVAALREAGCVIKGMVAIFTYGFNHAVENFTQANVKLNTLANYNDMIEIAIEQGYVNKNHLELLKSWRSDPENWGK